MAAAVLHSRPVGALACQRDSYLRVLDAEVVSCTKLPPINGLHAAANDKRSKSEDASELWQVEFTDSVLFPEGGGQHSDHGTLSLSDYSCSDPISIANVQRDGLRSVCHSPYSLEAGTKVRQHVDFERRWDHMQQHTGQHLLSAIMDTYDNLETLGWGMGTAGSSNYVDLPRTPSKEEMAAIQHRCNELIRDNLSIDVVYPDGEGLPVSDDNNDKGVLRVIKIGDLDANACCGTHLRQTSHIALLLLQTTHAVRGKNCRLSFVAGDRAVRLGTDASEAVRTIAASLSCGTGPADVVAAVDRTRAGAADARRREARLLRELAGLEAARLGAELAAGRNAWLHRSQEGGEFLNAVVSELKRAGREARGVVAVLAVGEERGPGQVVVTGANEAVAGFAEELARSGIAVKGNGRGERWQGKVLEWKTGELRALEALVTGPVKEGMPPIGGS